MFVDKEHSLLEHQMIKIPSHFETRHYILKDNS